jgi:pimeloyl-ACP methyl ester carboxylesterase
MADATVSALAAVIDATEPAASGVEVAVLRPDGVGLLVVGVGPPDGIPIVLIPGGGGIDAPHLRPLVRRLAGHGVWTLTPRGFRSRDPADRSLPRLAERYADALLEQDPRGEFVVAGYSMGGMVAYELATRLVVRGARVPLLMLLDTRAPGPSAARPPRDSAGDRPSGRTGRTGGESRSHA